MRGSLRGDFISYLTNMVTLSSTAMWRGSSDRVGDTS